MVQDNFRRKKFFDDANIQKNNTKNFLNEKKLLTGC